MIEVKNDTAVDRTLQVQFNDGSYKEFLEVSKYEIINIGGMTFIRITFVNGHTAHIVADIISFIGYHDDVLLKKTSKRKETEE